MSIKWRTERSSSRNRTMRGLLKTGAITLVCLSLLAATGCSLLPKEDEEEALPSISPPKLSKKPEYTVKTETLETRVRGSGKLMATKEESLFFSETGKRVKEVYVKSGEPVAAGQLIAELDVSDLESQLRQKRLQSRSDELRMIELLRQSTDKTPEQMEQARIDFELKREELVKLEQSIAKAKLTAPFAGTAVAVYLKKGDTVTAYEQVAIVSDLTQLTVAASITADDLKKVAVGMETVVDINGAGQQKGKVKQLPNPKAADNGGRPGGGAGGQQPPPPDTIDNYLLVELDAFPAGLQRGTPLSVAVVIQRKPNAVTIPLAALRTYAGRNYVQLVDEKGEKREVDVEIGQQTSTDVEIVKGLTPGQKVVGK
ncbi:efflux RND transporter periplasmic adaptor subunit [Paenibacillus koleovorans]|uniref:efflux RND transporter periplasmic adaptor subunit n=1 Tax=Paenibacillus koleovorans TaxID=121608 RepID=UPI000FDB395C|nr:biotin/lipoyl-binding protein [Paenibacillus koleovorans]